MKKPVIGVLPLYDKEKDSYWMLPAYFKGIEAAGGLPVMLPLDGAADCERLLELCDGLLFTGGQDVDPALYGEPVEEFWNAGQFPQVLDAPLRRSVRERGRTVVFQGHALHFQEHLVEPRFLRPGLARTLILDVKVKAGIPEGVFRL